jgi:hypothetical protein
MHFRRLPFFALLLAGLLLAAPGAQAQSRAAVDAPPAFDARIYEIVDDVSSERIGSDVRRLAGFGTRNTLSATDSDERGIGAARRWIKREFEDISDDCGGCLTVTFQDTLVRADGEGNDRFDVDTRVRSVLAVQRGTVHPNRYVVISGDIDSRATDVMNREIDAPGANDNATGVAGALEAARVMSQYEFESSVIYTALAGEEQGLYGGEKMAKAARAKGWDVAAVLNNDMIGNIQGQDGVTDNTVFRVFSEPFARTDSEREIRLTRYFGGEVDGPSRQLARYIATITEQYLTNLDAMMIYRLDRFGRGGHHTPFNNEGFPAVRIMEAHEDYRRQHQNIRTEDGVEYGDVVSEVEFDFAAKLTAVNAATLAALAWAPPRPENVRIGGAVAPSATLAWEPVDDPGVAGYKLYWRKTTSPRWTHSRFVGPEVSRHTLENVIIDNYYFGVAAVGENGTESPVVFPGGLLRE